MRAAWLLREGEVLASVDVADCQTERVRGLARRPGFDRALFLPGVRAVHTAFVRFPVDVAFVSPDLTVMATIRMPPWRVRLPRRGCHAVVQASAGSFERWGLREGDHLQIRDAR